MPFTVGGSKRKAIDYLLHVELGGITGLVAPIIGKQPADYHIWILGGASPAFIREEGQRYEGGPVWRVNKSAPNSLTRAKSDIDRSCSVGAPTHFTRTLAKKR